MFNEKYSHGKKFNVDSDNFEFISLDEYVTKFDTTKPVKVLGMFTFDGKYGERAALIANGYKITVPDHLVPDIKSIMGNAEEVAAINAGKCGFTFTTYQDKNGKTRNSGSFIDI